MPPKKRSNTTKEKSVSGNEARGSGSQSRIALDFQKLRQAGWTIAEEERTSSTGVKMYFRYTNPAGKAVKSSKDVERQLKAEGIYDRFVSTQQSVNNEPEPQTEASLPEEDPDYEPPPKQIHKESKGKW